MSYIFIKFHSNTHILNNYRFKHTLNYFIIPSLLSGYILIHFEVSRCYLEIYLISRQDWLTVDLMFVSLF